MVLTDGCNATSQDHVGHAVIPYIVKTLCGDEVDRRRCGDRMTALVTATVRALVDLAGPSLVPRP